MSATPEQIAAELEDLAGMLEAGRLQLWQDDVRAAAALIRAQAERVRVLESALREIDGEAPTNEPRKYSITGAPFNWDAETRELIQDIAEEAFNQGRARGLWEASVIASRALKGEA